MKKIGFTYIVFLAYFSGMAQVAINNTGNAPDNSAMLDIQSTEKGILIPRMTAAERDNITSPAIGLLVFVTDDNAFWYYDGTQWTHAGADNLGNHKAERNLEMQGHWISNDGDDEGIFIYDNGWVGLNTNQTPPLAAFHVKGDDPDIEMNMNSSSTIANLVELRYAIDDTIRTNLYFDKRDSTFYFHHDVRNQGMGPVVFNHGSQKNILVINKEGRIGIGTRTPDRLVQGVSSDNNASLQMETTASDKYASVEARSNIGNIAALSHSTGRPGPSRWGLSTVAGYYELVGATFNSPPESPLGMIVGIRENAPLFFGTNNLFRMVIKEDGNVGINQLTPVTKLDVNGIVRHGKSLRFYSNNIDTGREWVRFTDTGNEWGDNIFISAGAITAIGGGESSVTVRNNVNNADGHETLYLTSDRTGDSDAIRLITGLQNGWDSRVEAMTIQGDGDVGIGNVNPSGKLHIWHTYDAGPNSSQHNSDLVIGDMNGVHLELDNNEIHAMNDGDTPGLLHINADGGNVSMFTHNAGQLSIYGNDNCFNWAGDHTDSNYIRIGNLQIAWGQIYLSGTGWKSGATIDFPVAFSEPPIVTATQRRPDNTTYTTAFQIKEETTTGFTVWQSKGLETEDNMTSLFINWIAIGKWQ